MPIPQKAKPVNRSIMREEVYETLLKWIMEGVLRPGEKIVDTELAENLGVSRTPVREALRRLEDKELVEAAAGRWTRVAEITIDEAALIYPIIWKLEELAVDLAAAQLNEADFSRMAQANADLEGAIHARDPVKASKADARFHDVFIRKSANPHLAHILEDLKIKHRRLEVIYFEGCSCAMDSVAEHRRILAALRAGDVPRAAGSIRRNWTDSLERLQSHACAAQLDAAGEAAALAEAQK